jgi:L-ascorbate metabolism protein UlaG (beta-lactamase superfamily)
MDDPGGARPPSSVAAGGGHVTWFGHSTARVDLDGIGLLTDPVLGRWIGPLHRFGPTPGPAAIAGLSAALGSHAHHDHLDLPSLRRLDPSTTVIVPRGTGAVARRAATGPVVELEVGESATLGPVTVTAVAAHHDGRRLGRNGASLAVGYLIRGRHTVWFAGDTGSQAGSADLRGRVDLALVPTGGWGLTLGDHHMDAAQAADVCAVVRPTSALPVHWGTFAVPGTRHLFGPWWARQDGARFVRALADVAPGTRGLTPAIGERIVWPVPANAAIDVAAP